MKQYRVATALVVVALTALAGCAKVNDRAWRLFATGGDAYAVVSDQVLQGDVQLVPDRTGTVTLKSLKGPITSCFGSLRFTASTAGAIDLRCNDGQALELQFALLSESRGYAFGQGATGPASLTFGLSASEAKAYLKVSANKKLVEVGKDGALAVQ
jgi:hypothetical protein